MVDYMGLKLRHMDSTETGGSSYILHVGHAAEAIAAGKCSVALITLAGRPAPRQRRRRRARAGGGAERRRRKPGSRTSTAARPHNTYGMCAMRHMYEYGTTSEQLAWIKVAASHHAQ